MSALNISRDIKHALRMILRAPGFSLIAILTFAVGIGVNTAVFNVVNGVLLRPLPYPDADRITMVWVDNRRQGIREDITSYPAYLDWKTQNALVRAHGRLHAGRVQPHRQRRAGALERRAGNRQLLRRDGRAADARPRFHASNTKRPGKDSVVVISHGLWQRRFGGVADVLGRTINLNGRPREVIGVMPAIIRVAGTGGAVDAARAGPAAARGAQLVLAAGDRPSQAGHHRSSGRRPRWRQIGDRLEQPRTRKPRATA